MDLSEFVTDDVAQNAKDVDLTMPEPGRYTVSVYDWCFVESAKKKTPGIKFTLKFESGYKLFYNMWLSPGALPYTLNNIKKMAGLEDVKELNNGILEMLTGTQQKISLKHTEDDFGIKAQVWFLGPYDPNSESSSESDPDLDADDEFDF